MTHSERAPRRAEPSTKTILALAVALLCVAPVAGVRAQTLEIRSADGDDAKVYTISSQEIRAVSGQIGPLEMSFARKAASEELEISAADAVLQILPQGSPDRTPSGSSLNTVECGGGSFRVLAIGPSPPNLCDVLGRYPPAPNVDRIVKFKSDYFEPGGIFYQSKDSWTQIVFAQVFKASSGATIELASENSLEDVMSIDGMTLRSPFLGPALDADSKNRFWSLGSGAVARYTDKARVILPPGLRIITKDGLCARIEPRVLALDLLGFVKMPGSRPTKEKIEASFQEFGCERDRPAAVYALPFLIMFGLPAGVLACGVWLLHRWRKRSRARRKFTDETVPAKPRNTSAPASGEILVAPPAAVHTPPTSRLIRCPEGHIYDAAARDICPQCGARHEILPQPISLDRGRTVPPPRKLFGVAVARIVTIASIAALSIGLLGGIWMFGMSDPPPPPIVVDDGHDGIKNDSAKRAPETDMGKQRDQIAPAAITECDRLASSPEDSDQPDGVEGVADVENIAPDAAKLCRAELEKHPGERRFAANLARALRQAKDDAGAVTAYRKAAELKSPFANWALGRFYRFGSLGLIQNRETARGFIKAAAEAGLPLGQAEYAEMLLRGEGGPGDEAAGKNLFEQAIKSESAEALNYYIRNMSRGAFGPPDPDELRRQLERGVGMGSSYAMNELGVMYHNATGVSRNYAEAARLYTRATKLGNSQAMVNLGILNEDGSGVPRDTSEARRLYARAASLGNTNAMIQLGNMSRDGRDGPQDLNVARDWYVKAWEGGDANGLWRFVILFDRYDAQSDAVDLAKKAIYAARKGSDSAREELMSGQGLSRNLRAAVQSQLRAENLYRGSIDGKFGPSVREALTEAFKLPAD